MARRGKTRYHEAAHAVVAHKLGIEVLLLDRGTKEKGAERGEGGLCQYDPDSFGERPIVELLAICLCGNIAEEKYSKVKPLSGQGDLIHCIQILVEAEVDESEFFEYFDAGVILAATMVQENWDLIEKVAQLMYDEQTVLYPSKKLGL